MAPEVASKRPTLLVLAGVNGAGKSSVAGASLRSQGLDYYNPDEATARLLADGIAPGEANAAAWQHGRRALESAIAEGRNFAFETTLGGNTIPALIGRACDTHAVTVWFVGLDSPERHLSRVAARVLAGGHDIPADKIRARWDGARRNLIALLPRLHELRVYDNSHEQPNGAVAANPSLLLHWRGGRIIAPVAARLRRTPQWAKVIVEAALQQQG
ncbi:zeta toxin family protein [Lysobacter sp. A286]